MDTKGLVDRLRAKDGGFSISVVSGQEVDSGYMVSIYQDREQKAYYTAITPDSLNQYIVDNLDVLVQDGVFLGGWHDPDDDSVYLDISVRKNNLGEALSLAELHNQLAVYDLAANRSIPTNVPLVV